MGAVGGEISVVMKEGGGWGEGARGRRGCGDNKRQGLSVCAFEPTDTGHTVSIGKWR